MSSWNLPERVVVGEEFRLCVSFHRKRQWSILATPCWLGRCLRCRIVSVHIFVAFVVILYVGKKADVNDVLDTVKR